ncbi:MAG: hypothetical protein KF905_12105 [Flavobacteriales bacterium]|nr:hypothetical protein [Flavobacteriales bacterium]
MKMRTLATGLLLLSVSAPTLAQQWVDLMMDDATNLHEVKAAFDAEWEGRGYERGKGWKQFQRWYWFHEQRTWPSGERLDPAAFLEAMQEVEAMRAARSNTRDISQWEPMGPMQWVSFSYNPGNGRVNCIALDPVDPTTIYVGTPSSGLWRSRDDGNTWVPLFTNLPSMGVSGIAIHPTETDIIYIATGDGDGADTYSAGVLKSTDGGATWQTTGLDWNISQSRTTRALRMAPNNPDVLYCATSNGLWATTDAGDSWLQMLSGSFRDVEFMPGDSSIVIACGTTFFRSQPGGTNFQQITNGLPSSQVGRMAIAVTPADPQMVYALCSNSQDNGFLGLYRSTDGGLTFETRSTMPNIFGYSEDGTEEGGQAWYDMALAVDTEDPELVYAGGINVWRSINGGASWNIRSHWVYPAIIGYTHADIHSLDVLQGRLFCGSDGGIYVSNNNGTTWSNRSFGLDITQFYRMGGSEMLPNLVMAGAQDNGSNRLLNGEWAHVFGADGMEAAVDMAVPTILYASFQNGGLMRSDDNGMNFNGITTGIDEDGDWVTPFALDPQFPTRMVAGFKNVWVSEDRGNNWYQTTFWPANQSVRCMTFAPSDGNVLYVGRSDRAQRSMDGGFTWENIRPGLPNLTPTSFAVDHADPMHVWVSFSGTNAGQKVYESLDGGATWINRSAGLPNVPVNSIVTQANSPNAVYIGTDMGVFYRDDFNTEWQVFGDGLPNVVVSELEVNHASGKLRAATFGRGIWQADLYLSPFASIDERMALSGPKLIPQNEHGLYQIQLEDSHGRLLEVRVVDALGRMVPNARGQRHTVDLRQSANGAYNVVIITDRGTWVRRAAQWVR